MLRSAQIHHVVLLFITSFALVQGFVTAPRTAYQERRSCLLSTKNRDSDEDFAERPGEDADAASEEGQALANDFYNQLNKRSEENEIAPKATSDNESRAFFARKSSLFSKEAPENVPEQRQPRKFTGASPSSRRDVTSTDAVRREREQEFRLAGRFERTIFLQAGIAVTVLAFVLWVGLTGQITDGSDRNFGDDEVTIMGEDVWGDVTSDMDNNISPNVDVIVKSADGDVLL